MIFLEANLNLCLNPCLTIHTLDLAKVYETMGNNDLSKVYRNSGKDILDKVWYKKIEEEVRKLRGS